MIVTIAEPLEIKGEQAVVLADITIDTLTKLVSNVSTDENIQGFLFVLAIKINHLLCRCVPKQL